MQTGGQGLKPSESHGAAWKDPFSRKSALQPKESCCTVGEATPRWHTTATSENLKNRLIAEKSQKRQRGKSPSLQQLVVSEHRPSRSSSRFRRASANRINRTVKTVAILLADGAASSRIQKQARPSSCTALAVESRDAVQELGRLVKLQQGHTLYKTAEPCNAAEIAGDPELARRETRTVETLPGTDLASCLHSRKTSSLRSCRHRVLQHRQVLAGRPSSI